MYVSGPTFLRVLNCNSRLQILDNSDIDRKKVDQIYFLEHVKNNVLTR